MTTTYDIERGMWNGKWKDWGSDSTGQIGLVGMATDEAYLPLGDFETGSWALAQDTHKIYFFNRDLQQWTQRGRVVVLAP